MPRCPGLPASPPSRVAKSAAVSASALHQWQRYDKLLAHGEV